MSLPHDNARALRLMPREMRMMSERIFSLSAMPRGFTVMLTDLPMLSQHLGLGGFALLHDAMDQILAGEPDALAVTQEDGANLTLDFAGQPAWIGLNSLLDLAAELTARHGRAEITVIRAAHARELALATALAARIGLELCHIPRAEGAQLTAQPGPQGDPLIGVLNQSGTEVESDLWWQIYEMARSALAPDTAMSRRHAGVQIVTEDGTVIGRTDNDDDADVGFLARGACEEA